MTLTKRLFYFSSFVLFSTSLISGCKDNSLKPLSEMPVYEGPIIEARNVETIYSDSAQMKIRLKAPLQQEFESGDRLFPKGIDLEFYNEKGQISSKLTANHAKYKSDFDTYVATGNVIVKDLIEKKQLNTEELNWDRRDRRIHTDKFVRIQSPEETLMGEGLTAAQDFSTYKILKPTGVFSVQE